MNIAIIPARGGSKRIPRKNIREFAGKPMIAWSIEAAKRSGLFEHIIVSTDDEEIAAIAKQWGADVPFMRPNELVDDYTATRPVINHAIKFISEQIKEPECICCVYPTAPFITENDLTVSYNKLIETHADFVFSAATFAYPIQRAFFQDASGGLKRFYPEHRLTRSQDLQEAYHDAGQFYWGCTEAFLGDKDTVSEKSRAYLLPRYRVHDIDTMEDWERAELMFTTLSFQDRKG